MTRAIPTQTVMVGPKCGRTEANIIGHGHTPHWKLRGEVADGWFSANFNNETNGRLAIDITEFSKSPKGKLSSKRVIIELSAEAAQALAFVINAKMEG